MLGGGVDLEKKEVENQGGRIVMGMIQIMEPGKQNSEVRYVQRSEDDEAVSTLRKKKKKLKPSRP
jgi:hypothetical protein